MTRTLRPRLLGLALCLGLLGIAPPDREDADAAASATPPAAARATSAMTGYDPERAGHPLRVLAYALHPVGVILDYAIMRPAYWLGSHEPLRTLFGRDD